jgi:MoaA/NifB/PqqE/SkfB family radical SAM enzyme
MAYPGTHQQTLNLVKHKISKIIPYFMYKPFKEIYGFKNVLYYWISYAFKKGRAYPPKTMGLWVTWKCNCRCLMCPFYNPYTNHSELFKKLKEKKELTTQEIIKLIDDAHKLGVRRFSISGGEPFLRKDIIKIIEHIKKKGDYCSVFSNGILLNKELSKKLILSKVDCINLSLDGPKEIHNKIRHHNQAFQKLMENVEIIEDTKKAMNSTYPLLQFNVTISALNQEHLSEIMDIANPFGINVYYGYMYYTKDWMVEKTKKMIGMKIDQMSDQDLPDLLKGVKVDTLLKEFKKIKKKEKKYKSHAIFTHSNKKKEVYKQFYDATYAYATKCFTPWLSFIVDSFGEVYPCRLYASMGNIKDKKLSDIWNGKKYMEFRRKLKKVGLFPICAKCCNLNKKWWSYLPRIRRG